MKHAVGIEIAYQPMMPACREGHSSIRLHIIARKGAICQRSRTDLLQPDGSSATSSRGIYRRPARFAFGCLYITIATSPGKLADNLQTLHPEAIRRSSDRTARTD